jgi:hypothetical protein
MFAPQMIRYDVLQNRHISFQQFWPVFLPIPVHGLYELAKVFITDSPCDGGTGFVLNVYIRIPF